MNFFLKMFLLEKYVSNTLTVGFFRSIILKPVDFLIQSCSENIRHSTCIWLTAFSAGISSVVKHCQALMSRRQFSVR